MSETLNWGVCRYVVFTYVLYKIWFVYPPPGTLATNFRFSKLDFTKSRGFLFFFLHLFWFLAHKRTAGCEVHFSLALIRTAIDQISIWSIADIMTWLSPSNKHGQSRPSHEIVRWIENDWSLFKRFPIELERCHQVWLATSIIERGNGVLTNCHRENTPRAGCFSTWASTSTMKMKCVPPQDSTSSVRLVH